MNIRVSVVVLAILIPAAAGGQSLPSGWSSSDVGSVGAAGNASFSSGTFTVAGAGADIWGSADAFRFAYTTLTGDGTVVARVASEQYVANWTKAGVMMRESLTPGSRHALMLVSPGKGLAFQRRVDTGGLSTSTAGGAGTAPYFVRLSRTGSTIAASTSTNGTSWTPVGSDTISMGATIYVGLAVSSHVAGTTATATFTSVSVTASTTAPSTETLVFFRHGEKPSGGYGQLTCQGLNRALALPDVLTSRYGNAEYAFAPNPTVEVPDAAGTFYYVRPIATIEPTAIRLGLPLNTAYGYTEIDKLQSELTSGTYASSTVFVAWEHLYLQKAVQNIMNSYGAGVTVPAWSSGDFDSLYVVRITRSGGTTTAQFSHEYEGLNGLSTSCR
jgi:regulation of enolase protein 1 (concanavalin A-like superfamily)